MKTTLTFLTLALTLAACTDHYSTQDAYEICDGIVERNPGVTPPSSFLDCVACYETCGDDCQQTSDTSDPFRCPDDIGAAGGDSD